EVLLGQEEVRCEGQRGAAVGVLLEHEGARLVLPRNAVKVEDLGAFALGLVCEPWRLLHRIRLEIGDFPTREQGSSGGGRACRRVGVLGSAVRYRTQDEG